MGILPVPYNAKEVENILNGTKGIGALTSTGANQGLLNDLIQLKDTVAKQEQAFFNSIHCSGVNELSNKLQYWNNNSISNNLLNLQSDLIDFIKNIPKNNAGTIEAFLKIVNEELIEGPESQKFLSQFNSEIIGPTFYGELAKLINANSNIKFRGSTGKRGQPNTRTGLFKLMTKLQLKTSQKDGVFSIASNVTIEEAIVPDLVSKNFLKKIEKYCEKKGVDLIGAKATELLQGYLDSLIPKYLYAPYYSYYLMLKPSLIINASVASIIGFIGELRAAFQFIDIFGIDKISMVGSLTKLGSGQQVPIDMIFKEGCEMFGFQVKNYTISENNTIKISNTLSAEGFIDGRLNLTGSIGELLKAFFGTYQFNQPFKEHGDPSKVAEYDKNIYSQFPKVFDSLKTLFDQRVGDILKIRDNFAVEGRDNPFSNKQMYYNSFFIIGSRVVSSSSILDDMIKSIKESISNQTVNVLTKYEMSEPKSAPVREHAKIIPDAKIVLGQNFDDLASKISITYRITIRI